MELTSIEDAQRQMDVNFMGMVRFLHFVIAVMRKQGFGKIVCFSSIEGMEKDERTGLKPEYLAGKVSKILRKKIRAAHMS